MVESMLEIKNQTVDECSWTSQTVADVISQILTTKEDFSGSDKINESDTTAFCSNRDIQVIKYDSLTIENYLIWTVFYLWKFKELRIMNMTVIQYLISIVICPISLDIKK